MLRSVGSGWVVSGVSILVTYILWPFVLRRVGQEGYGTWLLITGITSYLQQLLLGVPMASIRFFAEHTSDGDDNALNRAVSTCGGLYLAMGATAILMSPGILLFLESAFEVPQEWLQEARWAFGATVINVAVSFLLMLPYGIFAAYNEFVTRNLVYLASLVLRLGLTLGLLTLNPSLVVLALIPLILHLFELVVLSAIIYRRHPNIKIRLADFDWKVVRQLFSFSVYVMLMSAGGALASQLDVLVIGAWLEVKRIPFYSIASSIVLYLFEFALYAEQAVMPMATTLKTRGSTAELRSMFLRWSKIMFYLAVMSGTYLIVVGPRFIAWWIDPSFLGPSGEVLQILVVSALAYLPVIAVAQPVIMGIDSPRAPALLFLAAGGLNVVLSITLVHYVELAGVALGTAIPNLLFSVVMILLACRRLAVPISEFIRYVVRDPVFVAIPGIVLLAWWAERFEPTGMIGLVGAGCVTLLYFGLAGLAYTFKNDEHVDWRSYWMSLRGRSASDEEQ